MVNLDDSPLASQYVPPADGYDEMYAPDGQARNHWKYLARALAELGPLEFERRAEESRRLLREPGVTYHVYGDSEGTERPWDLDPIPFLISSQEWAVIEAGLIQRAEVLNLLLKDLYGPRDLIKKGVLPAELVYAHGGFLRPCTDIQKRGERWLTLYAADLARAPEGLMCVLGDRTQAPSGTGYALANRMVISRLLPSLFREAHVHRLALFFQNLRSALAALSSRTDEEPRIVVLTPGPLNETYFEHGYLASYLGYPLVQGDDLSVSDGRVWLRSLQGVEPVDVILRRVDDHYCDPVELWPQSRLGVPGLVEAARRGSVAVVNPLGASLLENPALNAFLPSVARYFLGQDLRLPSAPTWWCGDPRSRSHVLAHLDDLVIKAAYREFGQRPVFGPLLSAKERTAWAARISAHPHAYAAQALLHPSSTPALVDSRFIACQTVLRSFLVARAGGYAVMPGGLTRVAPDRAPCIISNQAGAISKDTWVLASEPERQVSLWTARSRAAVATARAVLPSGAASNLFWFGRYIERVEQYLRLLRTVLDSNPRAFDVNDRSQRACAGELLGVLAQLTGTNAAVGEDPVLRIERLPEILSDIFDSGRFGNVAHALSAALQAAQSVRDRLDGDAWRMLHSLRGRLATLGARGGGPTPALLDQMTAIDALIDTLAALGGLLSETLIRGQSWLFLDLGKRLERALALVPLLRVTLVAGREPPLETLLLEAVLRTSASLITFRRRYPAPPRLQTVLDLLVSEATHPRSLTYQILCMQEHVDALPKDPARRSGAVQQLVREAANAVSSAHTEVLASPEDPEAMGQSLLPIASQIVQLLVRCSDALAEHYFTDRYGPQQLLTAETAGV
ncbi:MAG: circularly permuted type 2 ATP-grasp protein [Gammaproteobacteria bacterium]